MAHEMKTVRALAGGSTPKPKAARGYTYASPGRRADGTPSSDKRKSPQEQLKEAAQGLRELAGEHGGPTTSVPEPAPIFDQPASETRMNDRGQLEPPRIFGEPEPEPRLSENGTPIPPSIFPTSEN